MARREFEMTEEDLRRLKEAGRPTPYMLGSGGVPPFASPQENVNVVWKELGARMGFKWDSANAVSGKGQRFFTADVA